MPPRHLRVGAAIGAVAVLLIAWFQTTANERRVATAAASAFGSSASTTSTTTGESTTTTKPEPRVPAVEPPPRPATAAQLSGLRLTDVTKDAGIKVAKPGPAFGPDAHNGGVGVGDLDGDGDLDLIVTGVGRAPNLFLNTGDGTFIDVTEGSGVDQAGGFFGNAAVLLFDADGDGHLDVLLTGAGDGIDVLLRNAGDATFTDVSTASGVARGPSGSDEPSGGSFGAAAADWDGDGDLDLMIVQWYTAAAMSQARGSGNLVPCDHPPTDPVAGQPPSRTRMLRNDGTGTFTDVTAASGVDATYMIGFQPVFADYDGDGLIDLFVTGDACTSRAYRNVGDGRFEDVTADLRVGDDENGMGSIVSDIDGDGNLDWFVTGISYPTADGRCRNAELPVLCSGNRLYLGGPDGGPFTDATDRFGVRDDYWGWGATAVDLNNDRRRDLIAVSGYQIDGHAEPNQFVSGIRERSSRSPDRLWLGADTTPWPEVAQDVGFTGRGNAKAVVAFDADGDGDLDLVVTNTDSAPKLYRNDTPVDDDHRFLVLRLRQPGKNPYAIGARVTVDVGDGRSPIATTVHAGGSFQSTDPTDVHLGLGSVSEVARIEIRWPTGEVTTETAVSTNRRLDLSP